MRTYATSGVKVRAKQLALLTELAGLIAAGKLSTPIQATYDVAQIKEAVAAAAAGERQGKILITPSHSVIDGAGDVRRVNRELGAMAAYGRQDRLAATLRSR